MLREPGVEAADETVAASPYVSPSSALRLPGVEVTGKTVVATSYVSTSCVYCGSPVSKLRMKPWLPRFFRGALTQLPIRILREPGVEVTDETGKLPPHVSAVFNFCSAPPFVFPLRSLRGRCRLRQMRCKYIRAVGATLLQYVTILPELKSIAVGNGFIRSACYGFVGNSRSGYRNNRIGISVKAQLKKCRRHTTIIHY